MFLFKTCFNISADSFSSYIQESFTELDFIDRHNRDIELVKPLPIESTPFELIEEVKNLKKLAEKLHDVNEFAVSLDIGVPS